MFLNQRYYLWRPKSFIHGIAESQLCYIQQGIFLRNESTSRIFASCALLKGDPGKYYTLGRTLRQKFWPSKVGPEALRTVTAVCSHLGPCRMPFAWASKPIFRDIESSLDLVRRFSPLHKNNTAASFQRKTFPNFSQNTRSQKRPNCTLFLHS